VRSRAAKPGALVKWQHHDPLVAKARPVGERELRTLNPAEQNED
jgi:hypothetical protein